MSLSRGDGRNDGQDQEDADRARRLVEPEIPTMTVPTAPIPPHTA